MADALPPLMTLIASLLLAASLAARQTPEPQAPEARAAAPGDESPDIRSMSAEEVWSATCARCHGEQGRGNPPDSVLVNFEAPPRDFRGAYFNSRERRRDWFDVIKYGGPYRGLSTTMPSFGDQLDDGQISALVDYLKAFVEEESLPQGETNFIRAHFAAKAFPEQEFLVLPELVRTAGAASVTQTRVTVYYADRFADRGQVEVKAPVVNVATPGANDAGLGDVELGFKYAFFDRRTTPAIAAAGLEIALPTGDSTRQFGSGAFVAVPYLAAGVGVANKLQLQASTKLETPLATGRTTTFVGALAATLTLPSSRQGLFPGLELLAEAPLDGSPATLSLVPTLYTGITKLGHVAFSVGSEFPVVGSRSYDARFVAFFLWEYADGGIFW
jgi:mono/diheme cytochrome c family protein